MLERLGVQNEWRDKSKLAFAKLQKMLDPSFKFDFADPATAGSQTPGAAAAPDPRRRPPGGPAAPDRAGRAVTRAQADRAAARPGPSARFCSSPRSCPPGYLVVRPASRGAARGPWQESGQES